MAAPGTIVLAVADPAIKLSNPMHLFTSPKGRRFNTSECQTAVSFTIESQQAHVLITDLDQILGAVLQTPDGRRGQLSVNGPPLQLCYSVQLKLPDMMMFVGQNTYLSMLLKNDCLKVTPFVVTKEQLARLVPNPPVPIQPVVNKDKWDGHIFVCPPLTQPVYPVNADDDDDDDVRLVMDL